MVVLRCCPEASWVSSLAAKTAALVDIFLSDPTLRTKKGSGAGSRWRKRTKNMTMGGHSILQWLCLSLCVFVDSRGIVTMIGSDCCVGLEGMVEAEASILTI